MPTNSDPSDSTAWYTSRSSSKSSLSASLTRLVAGSSGGFVSSDESESSSPPSSSPTPSLLSRRSDGAMKLELSASALEKTRSMASLTPRCSESFSPERSDASLHRWTAPRNAGTSSGHSAMPAASFSASAAASLGSRPCRVSRANASRTSRVKAARSSPRPRGIGNAFLSALTARSLVARSSHYIKSQPPLTANCANPAARSATPAAIATHTTPLESHAPPRLNPAPPTDANLSPSARPASTASAGVFGLALTSGDVGREPQSNRLLRPPSSGASSRASGSSTGRDLDVMARG